MRRKTGSGASPTLPQVERSRFIVRRLNECGHDLDCLADALGYLLVRSQQLPEYADGVVTKSAIFMRRGMSPLDELFCIAHEDCHINFHSDAIAYQDLDLFQIAKDEAQANGYAMLVLFPDLKTFETEEHFLETSPMPEAMNQLRLAIKRKLNI